MLIDWDEVQKAISPAKNYEDVCRRLTASIEYPMISKAYNFSLLELRDYTQRLLGGDARGRYEKYAEMLTRIMSELDRAGVRNVTELVRRTATRQNLEQVVQREGIPALDAANVLKYLLYWVIPNEKYLSSLARSDLSIQQAIAVLGEAEIRYNLQLLQIGYTEAGRRTLADRLNLPLEVIAEMVNRADFSRLPWASKATISNIIGAGYGSLAMLANADTEKLYTDFFDYGKKIGKNLKFGNEIESTYRIAKIIPVILER